MTGLPKGMWIRLGIIAFILLNGFLIYEYELYPVLQRPPHHFPTYYNIPRARPLPTKRKFVSDTVETFLKETIQQFKDRDLAALLQNTYPNTLDTTVEWFNDDDNARTFLITGDIPAMWIRDSTNQVQPYLRLASQDEKIRKLIFGVLSVQSTFLYYDPYANAFQYPWDSGIEPKHRSQEDYTLPVYSGRYVFESKYELDSLSHFLQLTNDYIDATGDVKSVVTSQEWMKAMPRVLEVLRHQMLGTWEEPMIAGAAVRKPQPYEPIKEKKPESDNGDGDDADGDEDEETSGKKKRAPPEQGGIGYNPNNGNDDKPQPQKEPMPLDIRRGYRFLRFTDRPTESLGAGGLGGVSKACGLVRSAFRPSDDATTLPYLIPANAHLAANLKRLANHIHQQLPDLAADVRTLGDTVRNAIYEHAIILHPKFGRMFAYEVDCYGSYILMDDANTPSLLSLPLLGFVDAQNKIYQNTRHFILSDWNPWYFAGREAEGVGSPHTGRNMVWPMSIIVRILTSTSKNEVVQQLAMLKRIARHSGLIYESVHKDSIYRNTRPWFSWANGLASRAILYVFERYPQYT